MDDFNWKFMKYLEYDSYTLKNVTLSGFGFPLAKLDTELSMVVHICNPSTQKTEAVLQFKL